MSAVAIVLSCLLAATPEVGLARVLFPPLKDAGASPRDGSEIPEYTGAGETQLAAAGYFLKQRNEALEKASSRITELHEVLKLADGANEKQVAKFRRALKEVTGKPLEELRASLTEAVKSEKKRVTLVRKALESAKEEGEQIPAVDPQLIAKLEAYLASPQAMRVVEARVRAYRNIAGGLTAYLDGDEAAALMRMKSASEDAPDIVIAHVYLGSFYFLVQNADAAIEEWKKALALDPTNEAVRKALEQEGVELK
ncbi:MAG: hypothetical protein HYZ28_08070 [Myxococcales bacterium]|nr:hypothetical protein [Myxococcales bacterium]